MSEDARETVEEAVAAGGDADEILLRVIAALHEELGRFVRISFVEEGSLAPGPAAGTQTTTTAVPITFQGGHVADLEAGGELTAGDRALLEHAATLLAPYALVGWDTGGEEWLP